MKRSEQVSTSGITLVALVVTIVVLLILAGITIMYAIGDNSIFRKAQESKDKTDKAMEDEKEHFNNLEHAMNEYIDGNVGIINPPIEETVKKGEILTADKTEYTDENGDKALIPGGFCVVEDSKEDPNDRNTVKEGLVISDVAGDDLDNSKHGNQFVWIPVNDYSKFHLIEGYYGSSLQTFLSEISPLSREAGDTENNGSPGKPYATNSTEGSTESITMYQSVKENKGFYIARFEAGIPGTTKSTNTNDRNKQTQDGTVKPVSQKGVGVWNCIPWGGSPSDTATDGLAGNDNANGAVKVARSMYKEDGVHKVSSTLCYGVQWDAALNFIDSDYETGTSTGYAKDSTGRGNYTGGIATTGNNTAYQEKHIYDMAGNVWEWTMEAYSDGMRVSRGANYSYSTGGDCPASSRGCGRTNSIGAGAGVGFRLTLYI